MQHTKLTAMAVLAASSILAAGSALAVSMSKLPPEQTQGAVTYRSGGIGEPEAAAMRQAESTYPLSVEFVRHAKPRDEFLANVQVTIKDQRGATTLKTFSGGPFLLAKLPDGKYTVTAEEYGKAETQHIAITAGKPEHLVFAW